MNWIDIVLLSVMGLSILISLFRGFVKEALSLVTWIAALFVAITFSESMSFALKEQITVPGIRHFASFVILFVATIFVGSFVNYIVGKIIRRTPFSGADRAIGAIFGVMRGALVCSLVIFILGLTDMVAEPAWHESKLLPKVKVLSDKIASSLPPEIKIPGFETKLEKKSKDKKDSTETKPKILSEEQQKQLKYLKMFQESSKDVKSLNPTKG